jgi:phosphoglycerate dehydrogenase-like enzyme
MKLNVALALTQEECNGFFSAGQMAELQQVCTVVRVPEELLGSPEGLERWAVGNFPEVLVTAWAAPRLSDAVLATVRYVCHVTGGVRHLLTEDQVASGRFLVSNWGSLPAESVAEAGLMMALASLRDVSRWYRTMHVERAWRHEFPSTRTLFQRRVGIHGFGAIAQQLVRLLQPFRTQIAAFSEGVPSSLFAEHGVEEAPSLESLFSASDVIFEVESLTPRTEKTVSAEVLGKLRAGSIFVNVGRGAVVDEAALVAIARRGEVAIALDVYAEEPLAADSVLRTLPNVLLFPHVAGPTGDRYQECGAHAVANILRFSRGETPRHLVTHAVYCRSS